MQQRKLGSGGVSVGMIGLGCMGMSEFYGDRNDDESIKVIHRAIDLGVTLIDTADMYGVGHNEELVGKGIKGKRDQVIVATKFGNVRTPDGGFAGIRGDQQYVHDACDASLKRLGIDTIDLYYQHRVDPAVPIEETVGAMAELVQAGKVKLLGLSEASSSTVRRAAQVHPISALQTEYSLWSREPEEDLLPTCRELGITFVAYSPLGRGFLTGKMKNAADLSANDRRKIFPRFADENFQKNLQLVQQIEAVAEKKGCTPAQLALAWVLAQIDDIVPIPGTKRLKYLEENIDAAKVKLSRVEALELADLFAAGATGDRYPAQQMSALNR